MIKIRLGGLILNELNIEYYLMPKDREKEIWNNCIFVFDTSSLLYFYYYSKKTQNTIFENILDKLKGRLWIPGHVEYEYLKNREKTLKKPIDEKYKKLKQETIDDINKSVESIQEKLNYFNEHTKNSDKHPFVDVNITKDFQEKYEEFKSNFLDFRNKIQKEFEEREKEINEFSNKDIVLDKFKQIFEVGEEYRYEQIMEVISEGEVRYRLSIPPGFKDGAGSNKKEGIQQFGDLIIWKQMIDYADGKDKAIVFISNDSKPDWCYSKKRERKPYSLTKRRFNKGDA